MRIILAIFSVLMALNDQLSDDWRIGAMICAAIFITGSALADDLNAIKQSIKERG